MDMATLFRKVKRQFGDEYDIIINDNDIVDWANEAQLKIVRESAFNDVSVTRASNTFPVGISDKVKVKRVAIDNRALQYSSLAELDLSDINTTIAGTPIYWYMSGGSLSLWPTPDPLKVVNVTITYAKTPKLLTLVAPYLQWRNNPPSVQYASVAADTDFDKTSVRFRQTVAVDTLTQDFTVLAKALSGSVAASMAWVFQYLGGSVGPNVWRLSYSDGATIRTTGNLIFRPLQPPTAGEKITYEVAYAPATGVTTFTRINTDGTTVVDSTDTQSAFNISTTAGYDVTIGALEAGVSPTPSGFKVYETTLYSPTGAILFELNGLEDLATLPTIPASPFKLSTGQQMSAVGDIQRYSQDNEFSVPEVHHDDIVNFCIARAHQKNRNYRAADDLMEEFNQGVTTRRDENNSPEGPSYKLADPFDYGWGTEW